MPFPSSEADRLNHFLDARVQGRQFNPDDLDPSLSDAYERAKAMDARSVPDSRLMTDLWRTMMSTIPAEIGHSPRAIAPDLPSRPRFPERNRWTMSGMIVATFALVALSVASVIGYQQYTNGSDPGMPTTIPAAFQQAGTPTATGCEAAPREPGSVEEIVENRQTLMPYLPRFGDDPMYGPNQRHQLADGDSLFLNSTPDESVAPEIERALQQLVACRFYAFDSSSMVDMEGRYFALFSDDFLRRELFGYQEAGWELRLVRFWTSQTVPAIDEIRRLHGFEQAGFGNQYMAILETPENLLGTMVIVFVEEAGRWLVDEVGFAELPSGDASPVPVSPVPGAWVDKNPLMLDLTIHDFDPLATTQRICDEDQGTPVPCPHTVQRHGPYRPNEFPANTDFTITLYNLGEQPHRFEAPDLDIAIDLLAGNSETFVLNADPGEYIFTIYQGEQPDLIGSGVFIIISEDDQPTEG